MSRDLYVYVDVDETLVRNASGKGIPIPSVIKHVADLHQDGARLYCWSSGGADYARQIAEQFGIARYFMGFLPKPNILIDDQSITDWPQFLQVHPASVQSLDEYRQKL